LIDLKSAGSGHPHHRRMNKPQRILPSRAPHPAARSSAARHADDIAHRMQQVYAVVLAGGRGSRLKQLTDQRAKPAVPFAGKLKIIDFALSNCVNSGIRRIGVLTQYKAQSLIRHIERGWGFLAASLGSSSTSYRRSSSLGETLVQRHRQRHLPEPRPAARGGAAQVLILAGDHVYKMDYAVMLAEHAASGARRHRGLPGGAAGEACELRRDGDRRRAAHRGLRGEARRSQALPGRPGPRAGQHGHLRLRQPTFLFRGAGTRCPRPERPATTSAAT
jgi:glucose-1-phosphate adenylyltransferase